MFGLKKSEPNDLLTLLKAPKFNKKKVETLAKSLPLDYKDGQGRTYLHQICAYDAPEAIKWLVEQGLELNLEDYVGYTPLFIAAEHGITHNIKELLSLGADANYLNKNGRLAIQKAVRQGQIEAFNFLKPYTENLNNIDKNGENIVFDAVKSQNDRMIKEILIHKIFNLNQMNKDNLVPIFNEYIYKKPELAIDFVKYGADFNFKDNDGKNFLFYVIKGGIHNIELVEYLLKDGIDIDSLDNFGNNVLFDLVDQIIEYDNEGTIESKEKSEKLIELISILIEDGINLSHTNSIGDNILIKAINTENYELIKMLLDCEINPNLVNANNETALDTLTYTGVQNIEIVTLLLDYGASANIPDREGKTIIEKLIDIELFLNNDKRLKPSIQRKIIKDGSYFIILDKVLENSETNFLSLNSEGDPYFFEPVMFGNMKLVGKLAHFGADLNQKNKDGLNIIYKLMSMEKKYRNKTDKREYYSILKSIIGMGVNVNSRDSYGGITLHKAILENDLQTIKILIAAGADLNAIDNRGRNMIHNTIWNNRLKIFRHIYAIRPELLNKPDKYGVLPINYAAFLGYTELVLNFLDLGANVNSPDKKSKYILTFLKKFAKNLDSLVNEVVNPTDKDKILKFINSMKKDFPEIN